MNPLQSLRSEIERQLQRRESDAGRQHPAIISIQQQMRDNDYRNHLLELRHIVATRDTSSPVHWKLTNLPDDDLIWQVPTFHNNGVAIKQNAIKDRILFLRTRGTQNKSITSYIWDTEKVQDWSYGTDPSVLLVMGTSQQRKTLDTFGVEVVNNVKSPDVVLYLLCPLPDEVADLTTNRMDDILRQLAMQALQALHPLTIPLTLGLLVKVMELVASGNWFQALAGILALGRRVKEEFSIVIDTGVLRNNFHDADLLPGVFLKLIRELEGKVKLRVMIIVGRIAVLDFDPAIKVFSVDYHPKQLPPRAIHPHIRLGGSTTPFEPTTDSPATAPNEITNHSTVASASTSERAIHTVHPNNYSASGRLEESDRKSTTTLSNETKPEAKYMDSINLGTFQTSAADSSARSTEQWFNMLETTTHEFIYRQDGSNSKSITPIKIAVLDTGFAYTTAEDKRALKPYYQRVKKFVNFVEGGSDSEAKTDPSGHGTAVAVQILKVSLTTVLYICRVVRPEGKSLIPDQTAVERAIKKAAAKPDKDSPDGGGWGVDIINMSFGWPYNDDGVRKAIDFARQNGVHMFASTSNDGLLGPPNDILYPARSDSVIGVDAADGHGEHARYAPSSSSQHSRGSRFSAPGLGISSPNTERTWSGSSFACPIAAGVAALILEFARQSPLNKSPDIQTYLQETPAMLSVLRLASSEKGPNGLKFLVPWKLIGKAGEERLMTAWFIVDELRKEYGLEVGAEVARCFKPSQ
ncbi:peptidase S8/S53 domain-containing protein [Fusarium avenaceum]|nr:peptidase S8/S53 domain-containing protein [Fusarium avenaceum]